MGRTFYLFKVVWGMLAVGALARAASRFYFTPRVDPEGNALLIVEMMLSMLVLTFPLGLAALIVFVASFLLLGSAANHASGGQFFPPEAVNVVYFGLLLTAWASLFAAGYCQWFVLLPRRVAKARELKNA